MSDDYEAGYQEGFHHGRSTPIDVDAVAAELNDMMDSLDTHVSHAEIYTALGNLRRMILGQGPPCGDHPAPCNCNNPFTHDGH